MSEQRGKSQDHPVSAPVIPASKTDDAASRSTAQADANIVDVVLKVFVKSGLSAVTDQAGYFGQELGKFLIEHTGRQAITDEIISTLSLPPGTIVRIKATPVLERPLPSAVSVSDAPKGNSN